MNHEGPFIGATIDAVKKPSDTGRLRQWWLKKVEKPTRNQFVSAVLQRTVCAAGQTTTEIVAMERSGGEESTSRKNVESYGKCTSENWTVGVLYTGKGRSKKDSSRCFTGKARRDTRSVATGISLQRGSGASQETCGCRQWPSNDPARKERYRKEEKSSEWTTSKEYAKLTRKWQRMKLDVRAIVQEILRKSTDFLRRVIAPVGGMGGVTWSYVCPHCNSFLLEDYIWSVSRGHGDGNNGKKKHCSWWCAVCGGKYEWRASNRILVVQLGTNANEAKIFEAHATPQGL